MYWLHGLLMVASVLVCVLALIGAAAIIIIGREWNDTYDRNGDER